MNFVSALVYHFCLAFPAAFSQPGARLLVKHCISFLIRISSLLESEYDALHFPAFRFIAPCAAIALSLGRALSIHRERVSGRHRRRRAGGDSRRLVEYGSGASVRPSVRPRPPFVLVI